MSNGTDTDETVYYYIAQVWKHELYEQKEGYYYALRPVRIIIREDRVRLRDISKYSIYYKCNKGFINLSGILFYFYEYLNSRKMKTLFTYELTSLFSFHTAFLLYQFCIDSFLPGFHGSWLLIYHLSVPKLVTFSLLSWYLHILSYYTFTHLTLQKLLSHDGQETSSGGSFAPFLSAFRLSRPWRSTVVFRQKF